MEQLKKAVKNKSSQTHQYQLLNKTLCLTLVLNSYQCYKVLICKITCQLFSNKFKMAQATLEVYLVESTNSKFNKWLLPYKVQTIPRTRIHCNSKLIRLKHKNSQILMKFSKFSKLKKKKKKCNKFCSKMLSKRNKK